MPNNSQGKKQEVEDHCVLNDNHDLCVLHYINGVNSRTRQPMAVPVRTTEPKHDLARDILFIVRLWVLKAHDGKSQASNNFVEKFLGTVKFGNDQIAPILGYGDLVQGFGKLLSEFYCYIRDLREMSILTEWCMASNQWETSSLHVVVKHAILSYQQHPSAQRWKKFHQLDLRLWNPSQSVRTRRQLETDGEMCMFALTVSRTEPNNIKEAMADSAWMKSMLENFTSVDRLRYDSIGIQWLQTLDAVLSGYSVDQTNLCHRLWLHFDKILCIVSQRQQLPSRASSSSIPVSSTSDVIDHFIRNRLGLIYSGYIRGKNVHERGLVLEERAGRSMVLVGQSKPSIEEPIFSLNSLTIKPIVSDISVEIKEFLQLSFKFLEMPNAGDDALNTIVNSLASAATTYSTKSLQFANKSHELVDNGGSYFDFSQVRKELFDIYNSILTTSGSLPAQRS
ncbi:hypothetical protein Tco_0320308 [Tanacetum coccineum]